MLFRTREWLVHFDCRWPVSHPTCSTNCNRLAGARWPCRNKQTNKTKHSTTTKVPVNWGRTTQKPKKNIARVFLPLECLHRAVVISANVVQHPLSKIENINGNIGRSWSLWLYWSLQSKHKIKIKKMHSDIRTSPKSDPSLPLSSWVGTRSHTTSTTNVHHQKQHVPRQCSRRCRHHRAPKRLSGPKSSIASLRPSDYRRCTRPPPLPWIENSGCVPPTVSTFSMLVRCSIHSRKTPLTPRD